MKKIYGSIISCIKRFYDWIISCIKGFLDYMKNFFSWQILIFIVFIILFIFSGDELIKKISGMQHGAFKVILENNAEEEGLTKQFKNIQDLTRDQLKYCLIVCNEDFIYYEFKDNKLQNQPWRDLLDSLKAKGYITTSESPGGLVIEPTETGKKVYQLITDTLHYEISF